MQVSKDVRRVVILVFSPLVFLAYTFSISTFGFNTSTNKTISLEISGLSHFQQVNIGFLLESKLKSLNFIFFPLLLLFLLFLSS